MEAKVEKVTPETAAEWLATANVGNRKISYIHVATLASEMARGDWVENGQSICFNSHGGLLDGQQRLSAIVRSGKSYDFVVVRGVDHPLAFQTYDSVIRKRNANQIAQMQGLESWTSIKVAAARVILQWENASRIAEFPARFFNQGPNVLPHDIAAKALHISDAFDMINKKINHVAVHSGCASAINAMLIILFDIDDTATMKFVEKVAGGVFSDAGDPCRHYRERLLAPGKFEKERTKRLALLVMTVKAWNAFKKDQSVKLLRYQSDEAFPRPVGCDKPA